MTIARSEDTVEKVARAIDPVAWKFIDQAPDDHPAKAMTRECIMSKARAAINAMSDVREALVNAKFALEYWEREARICGGQMPWIDGPYERGLREIARADAALESLS